jgi:stage II sporulation protein D
VLNIGAMRRIIICSCLVLAFLTSPIRVFAAPPPDIRVLVINDVPSVTIDGGDSYLRYGSLGARGDNRIGSKAIIRADESGLFINGKPCGNEAVISSSTRNYTVGSKSFFGKLVVIAKPNGKLMVIDHLPLERYLVGIVGSEISPRWPIESIKAQVVAARTYALNKIDSIKKARPDRSYDITSNIYSQVYHGAHVEDPKATEGVDATRGEILYRDGRIFPAFYHSCCGGETEHAHNVWDGELGPPVIKDSFCKRSPKHTWTYSVPVSKFIKVLNKNNIPISNILTVATTSFQDSPRNEHLLVETNEGLKMIPAKDLRKYFGYKEIKSTWFDVKLKQNYLLFDGKGYGHGVGMCQWGAKGMADAGHSYLEILKKYYSDAEVRKAY